MDSRQVTEMRAVLEQLRQLVAEHSALLVGRTLAELDIPRMSFYQWYQQYERDGGKGLEPQTSKPRQFCLSWRTRPGEPVA